MKNYKIVVKSLRATLPTPLNAPGSNLLFVVPMTFVLVNIFGKLSLIEKHCFP